MDVDVDVDVNVDVDGDVDVDPYVDVVVDDLGYTQPCARCSDNACMLSFQRLDAYRRAVEFLALVSELSEAFPRGHADRIDQLNRSAESVLRNIAEGAGRWSPADVTKHYKIARGEAMECVASLDVLRVRKLVDEARYGKGIELCERVVATLTKLIDAELRG